MVFGRLLFTAAMLAMLSDVGHARADEYNTQGRDMYGNTADQNEAIRLRGAQEKARFAQEKTSRETVENTAWFYSVIPGAALLVVFVAVAGVVLRRKG